MPLQLTQHLHKLCVEIGTRPIGSEVNQAAADYLREKFLATGLNVEEQPFAFHSVPALAFSSRGAAEVAHYPSDTVDKVSVEKLWCWKRSK